MTGMFLFSGGMTLAGGLNQEGSTVQLGGLPWYIWLGLFILAVFFLWWRLSRSAAVFDEENAKLEAHGDGHEQEDEDAVSEEINQEEVEMDEGIQAAEGVQAVVGIEQEVETDATPVGHEEPIASDQVMVDDLTKIEGIGPKINQLLQDAGISTFAALAGSDTARLSEIVVQAGLRMANVNSWPAQASLAAEGKWDELAAYQDQLKGGREVA
jgi:predicted flap endonuclease-1-like 5' DNA nuclease